MARGIGRIKSLSPDHWLGGLAGVFLVLLAVQVARYEGAGKLGAELTRASVVARTIPEREQARDLEEYKAIAEKGFPGKQKEKKAEPKLIGILGDVALLGSSPEDAKPYALGAKVSEYEVVEIRLNSVVLEKDGKKLTLKVFPDGKPEQPPEKQERPAPEKPPEPSRPEGEPEEPGKRTDTDAGSDTPSSEELTPTRKRVEERRKRVALEEVSNVLP